MSSKDVSEDVSKESDTSSQTPHPSKELIEKSYDIIAPTYLEWTTSTPSPRQAYLEHLITLLPTSPRPFILDLGCGAGRTSTEFLCRHAQVTGNDISSGQLALAKENCPEATFIHADMMALSFPEASFDAVVAFFSIIHLPKGEQVEMLRRMFGWVKEGGYFVANLGIVDIGDDQEGKFLGEPMYWGGWDEAGDRKMVLDAGWEIVEAKVLDLVERGHGGEPDQVIPFLWILGRKKASGIDE